MIAGGGEQLTLRAVARLADACNVGGDLATVKHKFDVLRGHCEAAQRDYARSSGPTTSACCWPRRGRGGGQARTSVGARPLRGFVGTVSQAIDLVGQYRDAGVQLLISSDYRNDMETLELFVSEIMPHFA